MSGDRDFESLMTEALTHPVEGWDFSWLTATGRLSEDRCLPWNYAQLVARRAKTSPDLLDLGTGGGERLASLGPLPPRTVATESYAPNVPVAGRRLAPLGVHLVCTSGALDNNAQRSPDHHGNLPFRDGTFHLVIDRNEAFVASEVGRVLTRGGVFLTEQAGSEMLPLGKLLGLPSPPMQDPSWDLALAREQLTQAGLKVTESGEGRRELVFQDIGALVWYLRTVPWAAPGFSIARHHGQLGELHRGAFRNGPVRIPLSAFWLEAQKS
ncbi:Methyltransferase type 11 [mine drainage metagenome]|uniref:Methyltransferase type 11 n=1 Tax=mine drainage metagenome TaxID=410659 RepID=T1BIF4_9ZZZZ